MGSTAKHVVLGGGTGFIGTALKCLLEQKGYEVTVISRMPGAKRLTWFDISSCGLPDRVMAVVNLAGQNVLDPTKRWTPGFKQNVWNSRVNTTLTLAKAIVRSKNPPKVFVTVSGVGIYEPHPCQEYTEESKTDEPFDFLSKLALEWEKASELPEDLGTRVVNIRSGVVLGRQGGMIQQLYLPFFFGLGGPVGSGKQWLPWIHIYDICNLFLFAIEKPQVQGVLNGVAPELITNEEFTRAFAQAMRRPAFFRVPEFFLNFLFSEERAKIMTEGQNVKPEKVLRLGFRHKYPTIVEAAQECSKFFYTKSKPL